ncbi:MAG TPA: MlaD family protein [Geminicoccaceae bacterium]|nr:MlaD family protein [Geminicoccaceae bacterium]
METRASYLLVGSFVLTVAAGLALFALWLARGDIDRSFQTYEVAFTGSVTGLQEGSPVRYRGVPVGRVGTIKIDPDNIANILVTLELRPDTPVRQDTVAMVEMQGITGIASIQLQGGMQETPELVVSEPGRPPRIRAAPSTLEQVFTSTPEILARVATLLESLNGVLTAENIKSFGVILASTEALATGVTDSGPQIAQLLANVDTASQKMSLTAEEFAGLASDLRTLAVAVQGEIAPLGGQGKAALDEVTAAANGFKVLAGRLDRLVRDNGQPVADFSQSGLYEFSQMTSEARQLIAALSRITKELERDPAAYLFGSSQRGFVPR